MSTLFLENKYTDWYFSIIEKARSELRSRSDGYFESHHILPSCMNGPDIPGNRVLLTAREHFVVHCLLTKMVSENSSHFYQLLSAVMWFKSKVYNSRLYEAARTKLSKDRTGRPTSKDPVVERDRRQKISNSMKLRWTDPSYRENQPTVFSNASFREKVQAIKNENFLARGPKVRKPTVYKLIEIIHPTKGRKFVKGNQVPAYRKCGYERVDRMVGDLGNAPSLRLPSGA